MASYKSSCHDAWTFSFFLPLIYIHNFSISLVGSLVKHSHTALWFCAHNLTTNTVRVTSFIAVCSGHMTNWQLQLNIQIIAVTSQVETKPSVLHVLKLCALASSSTQRNITIDQMAAKILTTIPLAGYILWNSKKFPSHFPIRPLKAHGIKNDWKVIQYTLWSPYMSASTYKPSQMKT